MEKCNISYFRGKQKKFSCIWILPDPVYKICPREKMLWWHLAKISWNYGEYAVHLQFQRQHFISCDCWVMKQKIWQWKRGKLTKSMLRTFWSAFTEKSCHPKCIGPRLQNLRELLSWCQGYLVVRPRSMYISHRITDLIVSDAQTFRNLFSTILVIFS